MCFNMRTIHITSTIELIVKADDNVTMDEIKDNLVVTAPDNWLMTLEDFTVEKLEVTDSR